LPKRQRWRPIRGFANRVYDPRERWLLRALHAPGALLGWRRARHARSALPVDVAAVKRVLVLRLDRIGDLLMSLPALSDLRAALPRAHIVLAVGRWNLDVARRAPVDDVLAWSAPWAGRAEEGAESGLGLARRAWSLRTLRPDLALDLQGDVRASWLMFLSGARARVGYVNTGGGYLLTHAVPLDESVSWVEQNRIAVERALGAVPRGRAVALLGDEDRRAARARLAALGAPPGRPLVGLHPSGGRQVKQWECGRWRSVAERLMRELSATLVLTGSAGDRALAEAVGSGLPGPVIDLSGRLSLVETLSVIGVLDLFLSADTGPMHMACAVGTPSVSVFGPSDPQRYFSAGSGPEAQRHVVIGPDLWCAPCNLIRRPPLECAGSDPPECLQSVEVERVFVAAARLLRERGGRGRALPDAD
jgi:ADP-heptose:LPS heptosyltransferase